MLRRRVGVLRGGPSPEYKISLETGKAVLNNLPEDCHGIDVFIDNKGIWHRDGVPMTPYDALKDIDVVFNALHGTYGEDGQVQRELDTLKIPYTGPNAFSAAISMNKQLAKERFRQAGLSVPYGVLVSSEDDLSEKVFEIFSQGELPAIVKPVSAGSSLGVTIAHSMEALREAIEKAFTYGGSALVEEYIKGREATVIVVEDLQDGNIRALFPIEIVPVGKEFFDYDAKYGGTALEKSPGDFSENDARALMEMAKAAHIALGLRHYSRSDFLVSPEKGIVILETNSLPGLSEDSLMPKALASNGIPLRDFIGHTLSSI